MVCCRLRLKCDGTRAETRFGLSAKRTGLFKLAGASVQSSSGSRGVRIRINKLIYFVNCNWVNTRWQSYSTHNQYIEQHNNNRTTQVTAQHNNNRKTIAQHNGNYFWRVRTVPRLVSLTLAFALQLRKNHGKTSVRVVKAYFYPLPKHPHNYNTHHTHIRIITKSSTHPYITKPTHTHTHTYTHPYMLFYVSWKFYDMTVTWKSYNYFSVPSMLIFLRPHVDISPIRRSLARGRSRGHTLSSSILVQGGGLFHYEWEKEALLFDSETENTYLSLYTLYQG